MQSFTSSALHICFGLLHVDRKEKLFPSTYVDQFLSAESIRYGAITDKKLAHPLDSFSVHAKHEESTHQQVQFCYRKAECKIIMSPIPKSAVHRRFQVRKAAFFREEIKESKIFAPLFPRTRRTRNLALSDSAGRQ